MSRKQAPRMVGYIRVSKGILAEPGYGLEAQRRAVVAACRSRGWQLASLEQDIASGRSTAGRAGLERALALVEAGAAEGLVVAKLDRLSRSVSDFGRLLERARGAGWNIVALDFGLDLSTPQGELVANVLASVAQWERRLIGERTKEALAAARARGVLICGETPPEVVRRIRRWHRAGLSLRSIAAKLNDSGVPTPKGGLAWRHSTVRSIVRRAGAVG